MSWLYCCLWHSYWCIGMTLNLVQSLHVSCLMLSRTMRRYHWHCWLILKAMQLSYCHNVISISLHPVFLKCTSCIMCVAIIDSCLSHPGSQDPCMYVYTQACSTMVTRLGQFFLIFWTSFTTDILGNRIVDHNYSFTFTPEAHAWHYIYTSHSTVLDQINIPAFIS